MTRKILTILLVTLFSHAYAQKTDIGNWFLYFGNQSFKQRWNWHNEVQYRNHNFAGDLEQLLLRTGLGYNLTDNNNNLLVGYAFIRSEPYIEGTDNKRSFDEHRLFQQFITRQQVGRVFIQHRYRIEQRFFTDDYRNRFRYFLAVNVPVNKKTLEKNALSVSLYNEIFINGERELFDRNRLYGALGYNLSDFIRLELGLMRQILQENSRTQFQIVLFNNLPFK